MAMTMATSMMATVTVAMAMTMMAAAAVAKKTKAVTHRQQSIKIGSRRNVGGSGNDNGNDNGDDDDGNGDNGNDNKDDGSSGQRATAATDGIVWGRCQAAGGGGNRNKAEMGIMWV
jgi:hypothetical protein